MIRDDLLQLTENVLVDLTNKGTVRRALKELDGFDGTVEVRDDGTVVVTADDGTRCELLANKPFGDWPCTCLAGAECRHLVRAVLAYQRWVHTQHNDEQSHPPETEPAAPFDPGSITDEALAAALGRLQAQAQALVADGLLAQVGVTNDIAVVRLHHPVAVTVRFLAGNDLRYVRCTCADPDPCVHVALAVEAARGAPFGETGLRQLPDDGWKPDEALLTRIVAQIDALLQAGVEAGGSALRAGWQRLGAQLQQAEMPHLAALVDELVQEQERHASRSVQFDPTRLVRLLGELLARAESFRGGFAERIPDRLVAGSAAREVEVSRAKLIGLGCQVVEGAGWREVIAHVVDARSGAPMRVRKRVEDDASSPAELARRLVGSVSLAHWGGGQVLVQGGRRDGWGNFLPGRRRATPMPAPALGELSPPYLADSLAALAEQQTRLPAILDDRAAGTGLAVVRCTRIVDFGFDPVTAAFVASLEDCDGALARLQLPTAGAGSDGASALAAWCDVVGADVLDECFVAGVWRWGGGGVTVEPTLVSAGNRSLQPQIADAVPGWNVPTSDATKRPLTSPAALLSALDELLGIALLAGLDRLERDPRTFDEFTRRARDVGSSLIAGLAERHDAQALRRLLLASAFGRTLV